MRADGDDRMTVGPLVAQRRCVEPQQGLLQQSLYGEYLAMLLMIHAGFGVAVWGVASWQAPSGLAVVAAGAWIIGRAIGVFAGRGFTPLVTGGFACAVVALWQRGLALPPGPLILFSAPVFIGMLSVILIVDLFEWALRPPGATAARIVRRWRRVNLYRLGAWALVLAFVVYMIAIPTVGWIVERLQPPRVAHQLEELSLLEQVRLRSMEAMTAFWFFAVGATIGSFVNVVVYRMPRGQSVVFRRSCCPACDSQIKSRDNLPIFGWLLLEGRCRECRAAISPRYPIVESIAAALFLLLFVVELISGGANIPVRQPNFYHGVVWIIFYTKWDLVGLYLYHCFLLSVLLTWSLIDLDRQRVTAGVKWFVGVCLFLPPLIWPNLLPVPLHPASDRWLDQAWIAAGLSSMTGGIVGAALGGLIGSALSLRSATGSGRFGDPATATHITSGLAFAGLGLGWQAAVVIGLLTVAIGSAVMPLTHYRRWPQPSWTGCLLAAFVLHHVLWRWTMENLTSW